MTRGLGGQSPANVSHYLKGMDFPADKQDLIACAKQNGAEDEVLQKLQQFEDDDFQNMADVMKAYGDTDTTDGARSGQDDASGRTRH